MRARLDLLRSSARIRRQRFRRFLFDDVCRRRRRLVGLARDGVDGEVVVLVPILVRVERRTGAAVAARTVHPRGRDRAHLDGEGEVNSDVILFQVFICPKKVHSKNLVD